MKPVDAIGLARRLYPRLPFDVVFDVGANCGQTSSVFLPLFPAARIHAFEPSSASFAELLKAVGGNDRITCHRLALGAAAGEVRLTAFGTSVSNAIVADGSTASTEAVRRDTGDRFCAAAGIADIGYLKIDTEGHDLDVLRGFATMLREQRVDFVEVEAGMHHHNDKHVPFGAFIEFLAPLGYFLFQVVEQAFERHGRMHLRRANPIFVSDRAVRSNLAPDARNKRFPLYPLPAARPTAGDWRLRLETPDELHLPALPCGFRLRGAIEGLEPGQAASLELVWRRPGSDTTILAREVLSPGIVATGGGNAAFDRPAGIVALPATPLAAELLAGVPGGAPLARASLTVQRQPLRDDPNEVLRHAEHLNTIALAKLPRRPVAGLDASGMRALQGASLIELDAPAEVTGALAPAADLAAMAAASTQFLHRRWHANGYRAPGSAVAVLRDAVLVGTCSAPVQGAALIGDTIHFGTRRPWRNWLTAGLRSLAEATMDDIDEAAIIFNEGPHRYYHWHTDCLAAAHALGRLESQAGIAAMPLLVRPLRRWQAESLRLLGIPAGRLRVVPPRLSRIGRLYMPSVLVDGTTFPHPSLLGVFSTIRRAALEGGAADGPRIVYVSRLDATHRRPMVNEAAFADMLRERRVFVFDAREHDYQAQVRLFAGARVILGPHGAGLVNMGFAQPGAVVAEFFPPYEQPHYFAQLALLFGHRYRCFTAPPPLPDPEVKGAWSLDLRAAMRFLDEVLAPA